MFINYKRTVLMDVMALPVGCFTMAVLGLLASCSSNGKKENRKPNIIYILADDLGRAELGCYGQEIIETPHIDKLASEGMRFTNHYSGQAVSGPSRCSLFTGLHTGHAYIRGNDEMVSRGDVWNHAAMLSDSSLEGQRPVPSGTMMIPRKLKEAGYKTACIGKWGLGYPGSESTPNKMGFDFFYGYNCQRQAHTYYPPFLYRNECREYLDNGFLPPHTKLNENSDPYNEKSYEKYTQEQYAPDLMYSEMISFIEQSADEPFALFWTTPVPHVPLQAPARWVNYYRTRLGDEEPYIGDRDYFPCRYPRATYAAMVSYLDEQIGGLVAKLKDLGIYDDTIIIFASDNGPTFNGGTDSPFFNSARPFKCGLGWGKASLREGGICVPMIALWPGHIPAGTTSDLLSAFWDIMPTMCDIAGIDSPETDGISMLPEMLGYREKQKQHDFLYWEFPESGGQKALRFGDWKAFVGNIWNGNQDIELYNLKNDPSEQYNIASEHPELIEKVLEIFRAEHTDAELDNFNLPVW